jgi:hypothetical protein
MFLSNTFRGINEDGILEPKVTTADLRFFFYSFGTVFDSLFVAVSPSHIGADLIQLEDPALQQCADGGGAL